MAKMIRDGQTGAKRGRRKKVVPLESNLDSKLFFNRELSWLEFNDRVLHEAIDERTPLLERIKFLGIFSSNLDEFYMKRVGELKRKIEFYPTLKSPDGLSLTEEFSLIRSKILNLADKQAASFKNNITKELIKNNIFLCTWNELSPDEKKNTTQFFKDNLFPILTPLAVDPGHPFPFISNLSTSFGLALKHPEREDKMFARIKVPTMIPQWILLYDQKEFKQYRFVSVKDIIFHHMSLLFPGMEILGTMLFRITRNADWDPEEDKDDLMVTIEAGIRERKFAECVRLQYVGAKDEWVYNFLKEVLELKEDDIYEEKFFLDFTELKVLGDLELPKLKHKTWTPVIPMFSSDDVNQFFSEIKERDILVHHPYESFTHTVEKFIRLAAVDPNTLAIKMTLYRTGDHSLFVKYLIKAAESGKQVVCLVELRARFDEERNIYWANELEKAGVHVVYGVVGLKTHTKTALVVRRENDGNLCTYAHIGTGNYHSQTSNLYTDLGLFTVNKSISAELVELFHYLTGISLKQNYEQLLVAPINMRQRFFEMIKREVEHVKNGKEGLIIAKMNSMEDPAITEHLYDASKAGVKVILIIRGFCCLRPGVSGISENIKVISVIGRFLEHSRLFYFKNNASENDQGEFFIGSADWMYRNLNNRVEVITPILTNDLKKKCFHFLDTLINDHRQAWDLQSDGSYIQRKPKNDKDVGTHETLMRESIENSAVLPQH